MVEQRIRTESVTTHHNHHGIAIATPTISTLEHSFVEIFPAHWTGTREHGTVTCVSHALEDDVLGWVQVHGCIVMQSHSLRRHIDTERCVHRDEKTLASEAFTDKLAQWLVKEQVRNVLIHTLHRQLGQALDSHVACLYQVSSARDVYI